MPKIKGPAIRIELRDSRGRFTTLSRAKTVRLFFQRKKLLEASFPAKWKVAQRARVINQTLFRIEANYLIGKEIKKQVRQEKKLKANLRKEKIQSKKTVDEITRYKIRTYTSEYAKTIKEWVLYSKNFDSKMLTRKLDFTLKDPVLVNEDNINTFAIKLYDIFSPHLIKFHKQTVRTSTAPYYLFRIKYDDEDGGKNGWGISRFKATNLPHFLEFINEAFDIDSDPKEAQFSIRERFKKYIKDELYQDFLITGFSIECFMREM